MSKFMKTKNQFKKAAYIALIGILLSGCSAEDLYSPEAVAEQTTDTDYDATWSSIFGEIDPNQTWNTATYSTANVSIGYGGSYTVKVYSADPESSDEQAYLLGKFDVEGGITSTVQFDMPTALSEVYFSLVNSEGYRLVKSAQVENGEVSVSFGAASTRGVISSSDSYVTKAESISFELDENPSVYNSFLEKIPENQYNQAKVTSDFLYTSNGSFLMYFIYKNSSASPTVGMEYKLTGSDKWVSVDLFTVDNITFEKDQQQGGGGKGNNNNRTTSTQISMCESYVKSNSSYDRTVCEGVNIDLPEGTLIRFWVNNEGNKWYSVTDENDDNESHFATFYNGYTYNDTEVLFLGVEDWNIDYDLNDAVFAIIANPDSPDIYIPEKEEDTPIVYTFACEDLGSTYDYDFNDIVFGVSHVSGTEEATIIPLSAGGIMQAEICYENEPVGEIHELLGGTDYTTMINAYSRSVIGENRIINVPSNFTVTEYMGNFSVVVYNADGSVEAEIGASETGTAPQMIYVPGEWAWPVAGTRISVAYPEFGEWGANFNTSIEWYNNPAAGKCVSW